MRIRDQINKAYSTLKTARARLRDYENRDTSYYPSPALRIHHEEMQQLRGEIASTELEIERLKLLVQAGTVEDPPVYAVELGKKYVMAVDEHLSGEEVQQLSAELESWLRSDQPFLIVFGDVKLVKVDPAQDREEES